MRVLNVRTLEAMGSFKKRNAGSTSEFKNFPKAVQRINERGDDDI